MISLLRTEFVKAAFRTRTLVITLLLIGLPTLIVVAIKTRGDRPGRGDNAEGLFRLAQQSGLLVPAAVLSIMSAFLLVVIAGLLAADSVAGDAAWGNLRYVLMRPVGRARLLVAKAAVAGFLIWACVLLVALTALAAGFIAFGSHPLNVPAVPGGAGRAASAGFQLATSTLLVRVVIVTAYVAFGFTALLALGTFFSTLTDTPTGAIGATVGVYIVSEILDGITQLGNIRYGLPTHYLDSWQPMFTQNQYPHDMLAGLAVQVGYLIVFGAAAIVWFRRKDIRS
ncbi:MAG TPA: ABC transporter permease subunit [Acidimicrobiales bacterium]